MAKIAVYSKNPYGMGMIRAYIEETEIKYGGSNEVAFYDSEDVLLWDADSVGMFDVVIVYRDWQAAAIFRRRLKEVDIVMVAQGMSRRLYDVQPCYQSVYGCSKWQSVQQVFCFPVGVGAIQTECT